MKLEAGQVVLLPFPHTNLKTGKKRPALVLTGREYHDESRDTVLAYVTSQHQTGKWSIKITAQDLSTGKLVKDSWVRVDRLATVEQGLVQGVVGQLKQNVLRKVRASFLDLLG